MRRWSFEEEDGEGRWRMDVVVDDDDVVVDDVFFF
jgi:hypothetical protein